MVFLANPNNPTGSLPAGRRRCAGCTPGCPTDVLLVIDAAYAEYVDSNDYEAGAALVAAHDNVVMLRTFSKIYGLAALRLGWAYGPPAVIDVLNRLRGPFNVTAPAQAAGVAALDDQAHVAARARPTTTAGCPGSANASRRARLHRAARAPATSCWCDFPPDPRERRRRLRLPQRPRHHPAPDGCLRPARLPAHHHRAGREMAIVAEALDAFAEVSAGMKRRAGG